MTIFFTNDHEVATLLRERLASESEIDFALLAGTTAETYAAVRAKLQKLAEATGEHPSPVVVLDRRASGPVRALSRVVRDGTPLILDHTAVGHLQSIAEEDTPVSVMSAAALSLMPAHHVIALVGPTRTLVEEARRCATTLASKLDRCARTSQPSHVGTALEACDRLASRQRLSVTQRALLRRAVRSAAIRLGSVPTLLGDEDVRLASHTESKQHRNEWFRNLLGDLDEYARPEI